jgi:hypothetical protein
MACIYVLFASAQTPRADAAAAYGVAEGLVQRHTFETRVGWGTLDRFRPGKRYSISPILHSLVHVPGEGLRALVARHYDSKLGDLLRPLIASLGAALPAALGCALFFSLCLRLGVRRRVALATTFVLGLCTYLAVYARIPFAEAVQAALAMGVLRSLYLFGEEPRRDRAASVGAWLGLLLSLKVFFAIAVPGAVAYALWAPRGITVRRRLALAAWIAAAAFPFGVALLAYNHLRFGSPFVTGYGPVGSIMSGSFLLGLAGVLISVNKSLFLFAPPLVLSVVAAARFARLQARLALAIALTIFPPFFAYCAVVFWAGDWSWGPRYHLFAVPALMLPVAVVGNTWRPLGPAPWRAVKRLAVATVLGLGLWAQILGSAFSWDHFYYVGRRVQWQWIGRPSASHSLTRNFFEDGYGIHWLLPLNPMVFNQWFFVHQLKGTKYREAIKDAPWVRYTTLPMPAGLIDWYWDGFIHVDWWLRELRKTWPRLSYTLAGLMTLGAALSGVALGRGPRRRREPASGASPPPPASPPAPPAEELPSGHAAQSA